MNKNILRTLAVAVLALAANGATAQTERLPAPVIGIVDTDLILRDSLASKGVFLERDKYATQYQTQVTEDEKKLRTEDQELAQQRGVMAPDVFQKRVEDFQKKLADYQTKFRDKSERLNASVEQSLREVEQIMMTVTGEVVKERGINLVVMRRQILIFSDPGMDITAPVLTKLNQRLASVKFQDPATLQRLDEQGNPVGGALSPVAGGAAPAPKPAAAGQAAPKKP
ncbi:MAG: OmpH family outer membrane protein [Rhodospirillaceae bacterium]|nr:OmpH family outer membrane protein [Rhodospirillaceae bacterium]